MEETIKRAAEDKVGGRYKDLVCGLEGSIRSARLSNDKISQQLFSLNNRTINVAQKIGFFTFEDLEEAVLNEPEVWTVDSIKKSHGQALRSRQALAPEKALSSSENDAREEVLRVEFEQLKHQVHILQQRSDPFGTSVTNKPLQLSTAVRSPLTELKSIGNASRSEESALRVELDVLSRKYDAIVSAKERAEKKYKEDYRKWKYFKSWILDKSKHAKALRAQLSEETFDFAGEFQEKVDNQKCIPEVTPSRKHASPSRSTNEDNVFFRSSPSENRHSTPGLRIPSTGRPSIHDMQIPSSERYSAKISRSYPPSPTQRKRKRSNVDLYKSLRRKYAAESPVIKADSPEVACTSAIAKGRYASAASAEKAINALYAIDTSRNHNADFQYDEIVRGKEHRQRLEAGDCDCCKEYYDCLEPLPSRLAPPAWDSAPLAHVSDAGHPEISALHKKQISRHRHQWSPAKTPPDYWNIGFPTTQEAAEINRRAAEMHADKRRRVEKEANTKGGRYIKRQDK